MHAHRVQRRAHRFRRAIDRAADAAIGIACPHHQRSEVQRLLGHRRGFHLRDPLGSPALVVQRGILFHQRRVRRIDKLHALRRVGRPGADQHGFDHAFPRQARRRLQHARVRAFGERDRLFQIGSTNYTPSGALAGLAPISTGLTTPARARRAAASSARASVPSGNAIVFFSLRARSMSPVMKSFADSGIAAICRNPESSRWRLRWSDAPGGVGAANPGLTRTDTNFRRRLPEIGCPRVCPTGHAAPSSFPPRTVKRPGRRRRVMLDPSRDELLPVVESARIWTVEYSKMTRLLRSAWIWAATAALMVLWVPQAWARHCKSQPLANPHLRH